MKTKTEIRMSLKSLRREVMVKNPNDKPMICQALNDYADHIVRELGYMEMKEEITQSKYKSLSDFTFDCAASLQPK